MARKLPFYYDLDQYQKFMSVIQDPVHKAIFTILFGTGLRICELIGAEKRRCITCKYFYRYRPEPEKHKKGIPSCQLTDKPLPKNETRYFCEKHEHLHPGLYAEQVNLTAGTIRIFGKGKVERIVTMSPKAIVCMQEILQKQPTGKIDFRIRIRRVEQLARFYAQKAGLPDVGKYGRWSPHKMRHTHLTRLVQAAHELGTWDAVLMAQEQAGHANLETTALYLHMPTDMTKKTLEKTGL